jgi:MFS family permease
MSVWLAGSAVGPALALELHLTPSQMGWVTSAVQLGFVGGTLLAAILNLPDILAARWYFAGSAVAAAMANAWLAVAGSFESVLIGRVLTGVALAGVYPPAMKMAATWFREERGLAIGTVVGALTAGKAVPYLLEGAGHLPLAPAVLMPSGGALVAGLLVAAGYRDGPFPFPARPFSWGLVATVARARRVREVTAGYLGHMWELYAVWTWIPAWLAASFAARGRSPDVGPWAFACVAIGAIGCVWGGRAADRVGRLVVVRWALQVSGLCCLASAAVFGGPPWLVVALGLVWGIAVIADSAQFSAMVTEEAPSHAVGTALTLQTSLGFLLTVGSIQLVPALARITGWRWALVVLALGPMAGLAAVRAMVRRPWAAAMPNDFIGNRPPP